MPTPRRIDDIDTPAVLIDIDRAEANIDRAQAYADRHGLKLRPHIKTHKLPFWAKRQVEAGAAGITCQKIGEAEVMADAGLVGHFPALQHHRPREAGAARGAASPRRPLGHRRQRRDARRSRRDVRRSRPPARRCWSNATPAWAAAACRRRPRPSQLASEIDRAPGLRFGGLMTYPPAGRPARPSRFLSEAKAALIASGLDCGLVSSGGTPDMWRAHESEAVRRVPARHLHLSRPLPGRQRRREPPRIAR